MAYVTINQARRAADRSRAVAQESISFDSVLQEEAKAAKDGENFDIFLSHSIRDASLVRGVGQLLREVGMKVYVDWIIDPSLDRAQVDKQTAGLLRRRMRQSSCLIYIATKSAVNSKWMPWELGYFDGYRPGRVYVLPLVDSANDGFVGQEYLSLYPEVDEVLARNLEAAARESGTEQAGIAKHTSDLPASMRW